MANIYYRLNEPMGAEGVSRPWFGQAKPVPLPENLTPETVGLFLREKSKGLGLNDSGVPLPTISWRTQAVSYAVAPGMELFLPPSIHLTDGQKDYFIVLVGGVVELRCWPSMRLPDKTPAQWLDHRPATAKEASQIARSFAAAWGHLGVGQSLRGRFGHLRGRAVPRESILSLLRVAGLSAQAADNAADRIVRAAADPVDYFERHADALAQTGVNTPTATLYHQVFLNILQAANCALVMDWKAEPVEVHHAMREWGIDAPPPTVKGYQMTRMLAAWAEIFTTRHLALIQMRTEADEAALLRIPLAELDAALTWAKACKLPLIPIAK